MDTMTLRNFISLLSKAFPLSSMHINQQKEEVLSCRIALDIDGHEEIHRVQVHRGTAKDELEPDDDLVLPKLVWEKVTWGDGGSDSDWQIQDEFEPGSPADTIGWVSWLRGHLPRKDKQARRPYTYHHMPNSCLLCWNWAGKSKDPDIWDLDGPLQFMNIGSLQYNVPDSPLQYLVIFPHPTHPDAVLVDLGQGVEVLAAPRSLIEDIEDAAVETLRDLGDEPVTASPKGWSGAPVSLAIIEEIEAAIKVAKMEGKGVSHIFVNGQTYNEIREHVTSRPPDEDCALNAHGPVVLYGASVCLDPNVEPGKFTLNARHFAGKVQRR